MLPPREPLLNDPPERELLPEELPPRAPLPPRLELEPNPLELLRLELDPERLEPVLI